MNTTNERHPFAFLRSKLAFRLWGAMMILAAIGVAFLWIVQILLFEPNYIDASISAMQSNVAPLAEEVAYASGAESTDAVDSLRYFSKSTSAKVLLVANDGTVVVSYSHGKQGVPYETEEAKREIFYVYDLLPTVINGETGTKVLDSGTSTMGLAIGVPTVYQGEPAALFVYQSLAEMSTMQELNRNQLIMLSVVLTLVASLISLLLTRHFTRPIRTLEDTVRRLAEGELTATPNIRRNDELGRLSDSVEELGHALQRVDVLRKDVIANVSHELRAPLSLILGYSEMVRDVTGDDPARRNANMDLIIQETTHLSQMMDDIMDYSQFQSGYGTLHTMPCNLVEIVETELAIFRQVTEEQQVRLALDSDAPEIILPLDRIKMSQVLRNLLSNAFNHTAGGDTIRVRIIEEPDAVRVQVINPGSPISPEDQTVIWERYQCVQHQGGRRQGTGIGLSIVSTLLQAHGMTYGVDSVDGENIFWFAAPRR